MSSNAIDDSYQPTRIGWFWIKGWREVNFVWYVLMNCLLLNYLYDTASTHPATTFNHPDTPSTVFHVSTPVHYYSILMCPEWGPTFRSVCVCAKWVWPMCISVAVLTEWMMMALAATVAYVWSLHPSFTINCLKVDDTWRFCKSPRE